MKKLFLRTISLFLLLTMLFTVSVSAVDISDFPAKPAGENKNLTWEVKTDTLIIRGKDKMYGFSVWGENTEHPEYYMLLTNAPWRDYRETIKTVVLEEGVQSIGWFAFNAFTNLETVYIPKSVTLVEPGAFNECTKLKTICFAGKESEKHISISSDGNQMLQKANWVYSKTYDTGVYSITYELGGGKNNANNPASYKKGSSITLANPTRAGYTFGGWYKDSAFTTKVTAIKSTDAKNLTLYAKWTANSYTISFNANGGSGSMSAQAMKYGSSKALKANAFTKTNYTFIGWNTKKDGSGTSYNDGANVKNLTKTNKDTLTLYAQWKRTTYTITFNGNGAVSGSTKAVTAKVGTKTALTANGFKRTGYTFTGWNTKANGTGKSYTNKQSVLNLKTTDGAKITLYAQWKLKSGYYTITYHLNSGKNNTANPAVYTSSSSTIALKAPTRTGYTFAGWYSDSKLTKQVSSIRTGSTGNKTLYAKWTANTYTIAFNGNGADSGSMKPLSCTYGKSYPLPACSFIREDYTFAGWNTKADGSGTFYDDKQVIKNLTSTAGKKITLYAQWVKPEVWGTDENVDWVIFSNGLLAMSASGNGAMKNYQLLSGTTFGVTFKTSTAPWASRGTGTRDLVQTVVLGDGFTRIGNYAFAHCYKLESIIIPDTVTEISIGAFDGCTALTDVIFAGTQAQWKKIVIATGNDALTNANIYCAG